MLKHIKIGIIGLGYVGLPLAIEFSKKFKTYGFDKSKERINQLKKKIDKNNLLNKSELNILKKINFESSYKMLDKLNIIIVCLPTPVKRNKKPDLKLLKSASKIIGKNMKKNTTIVFESTVYPGVTEEICIPIIEKSSKLTWKKDFFVGYSPERISPGKNYKKLSNIKKIISGDTIKTEKILKKVYSKIIKAGLFVAKDIKTAEAAKILENTQRDVNIALMNEVSMIFDKLNINTREVIEAASTKWNFGLYYPGLVGGHCIGIDPYYLSHKSKLVGEKSDLILTSRKINENMSSYIFNKIRNKKIKSILILGITYKEDCNDLRNSKILDLIKILKQNNYHLTLSDDIANPNEFQILTGLKLKKLNKIKNKFDLVILSQPHNYFNKNFKKIINFVKKKGYFFDLKSYIPKSKKNNLFWEL
tara:strand:- start:404 stop:1660 length:1257 start_codon:yes stop_codon:yes gene_type:complete